LIALALALGASVSWGVGDFLGGVSSRRLPTLVVLAVSQPAGLVGLVALALAVQDEPLGAGGIAAAAAAGAAGALGLGGLYRGMAVGAMGVVAPVSTLAAVLPVAVGLARGERPGALQLLGAALILAGVVLVSREPGAGGSRIAAGVGLALVAATGFGLYFVFIDVAADESATWAVVVARATASALCIGAAVARGAGGLSPRALPALTLIGLLDASANVLLAAALTRGYVSLVSVLASLYPVVTVLLARTVLAERVATPQTAGIGVALGGVALVAAG
jgi:drug/metabolite transporter (DMT)-like permease